MTQYNWMGNFARHLIEMHNPALRGPQSKVMKHPENLNDIEYKWAFLYLDPGLGGSGGMSLTRFHIRQFPDPITESLTFWKIIYKESLDPSLRSFCAKVGNPKLCQYDIEHFQKLMEDQTSLNITHGISAAQLIKDEVKNGLISQTADIKNELLKSALLYITNESQRLLMNLRSATPLFPRFLSEFRSATFEGIAQSLVGLFSNSKTLRNLWQSRYAHIIQSVVIRSELSSIYALTSIKRRPEVEIWTCSSTHADLLREKSWNAPVVGTTVPHPAEMLDYTIASDGDCRSCLSPDYERNRVTVVIPKGYSDPEFERGFFSVFIGSATHESTSLLLGEFTKCSTDQKCVKS
jgi:Mononegavirales RNA dependent RNA polymerase/Mononegavirales mRNA-capping region V